MLRAYENAIKTWQPWWTNLKNKKSSLVQEEEMTTTSNDLNERLVKSSESINTSKASPLIYNEIIKSSYLYILLTHVYQLDEEDFDFDFKSAEIEINEICSSYLEIEKLCAKKEDNSALDLATKFDYLIACLLQEDNYFLKVYYLFYFIIQ